MRILVVDDEPKLRRAIHRVLKQEGYSVEEADNGPDGLASAVQDRFDVVVLDVLLPGLGGYQVCKAVRASGVSTPILMLTALGEVDQRVIGLDAGADDYLVKPFAFKELLARLRALTRRQTPVNMTETRLTCEDLELDLLRHEAHRSGQKITLTTTEFRLLELLIRNREIVLSRGRIMDEIWGLDYDGESSVVETYIHYLRRKIDAPGLTPLIRTVRGAGYTLGG